MSSNLQSKNDKELNEIRNKVIQGIAENMDLYGITDSIGRLYGTLYFSDRPLTLDEMRESLGMSKTSMSTGVRTLLETKMVRKVWIKGERKDLYQAEEDWYKSFFAYFSTKWIDAIEENMSTIAEAEQKYLALLENQQTPTSVKVEINSDLEKMHNARNYYRWLKELIGTFESGKIFDLVPKHNNE